MRSPLQFAPSADTAYALPASNEPAATLVPAHWLSTVRFHSAIYKGAFHARASQVAPQRLTVIARLLIKSTNANSALLTGQSRIRT
jgi:hypothetical protein